MITPQSSNWTACVASKPGRRPIIQALIEGIPDVLCSEQPADPWQKNWAISASGYTSPAANYIGCGTSTALTQLSDWTIICWRKNSNYLFGGHVAGSWAGGTSKGYGITDNPATGGALQVRFSGTAFVDLGAPAATNGTWDYLAASVGGLNSTVSQGVLNNTAYGPKYTATSRASRASWTAATEFSLLGGAALLDGVDGSVGYCAVFNRALTTDEMKRLKYRCLSPRWGNDDSDGLWDCCVAEYRAERGTGTTLVNNRNPGTHDGTLNGNAAWSADPPFSVTYRPLGVGVTTGASIDVLATRTTIQSTALRVPDVSEWLTSQLASTSLGLLRRNVRIFLGFSQILESEYQPVMSGKITDIDYEASVYTLGVSDPIFDAKSKITIGVGALQAGINAAVTTAQIQTNRFLSVSSDQDGKVGYVKIDSEIIAVGDLAAVSAGVEQIGTVGTPNTRGALSSTAATHSSGAAVSEVVLFDWAPLTVARYLLMSNGGFEATSAFDGVVESAYIDATTRTRRERGAKMSPSDVASAEIGALAAASYATLAAYIEEDIPDIKDWIEREILRGAGCYFAIKPDGRLTIRSLLVPTSSVYSLTPDRVRGKARWKISDANIVNWIDIEYGYNILTGNNDSTFIATDATSGQTYGIRRRSYTLPASTSSSDLTTVTGQILQRFKNPTVTLEIECGLYEMMLEIGDAVKLTDWSLPDIVSGYRGVTKLLCEVTGRSVDFSRGTVKLTLLDISRM